MWLERAWVVGSGWVIAWSVFSESRDIAPPELAFLGVRRSFRRGLRSTIDRHMGA